MATDRIPVRPMQVLHASSTFEAAIRFIDWAERQGAALNGLRDQQCLGLNRATAYRWVSAYRAARGQA